MADDFTELFYDIQRILSVDHIEGKIRLVTGNGHKVAFGVADIKGNNGRVVEVHAKAPRRVGDEDKVVGSVKGNLSLCVHVVVGTVAGVEIAPFVDTPAGLPKAVDNVVGAPMVKEKGKSLFGSDGSV